MLPSSPISESLDDPGFKICLWKLALPLAHPLCEGIGERKPERKCSDCKNAKGQPRLGPASACTEICSQHCLVPILFVDRTFGIKRVERESKGDVMDGVDKLAVFFALDRHIADIAALRNVPAIHGGVLAGFPGDQ